MTPAETSEKCLESVREQFRIMGSFSKGNRASWYQEVEQILNRAKADLSEE
jgi:hypothetical protein